MYGFGTDLCLLFLCKMQAITMASATATTARTSKKADTVTHTGNVLSEGGASESGDEPTPAVLVAVTTALVLTVEVSVTVIACITVTTCTLENVDALLSVDKKRKVHTM